MLRNAQYHCGAAHLLRKMMKYMYQVMNTIEIIVCAVLHSKYGNLCLYVPRLHSKYENYVQ